MNIGNNDSWTGPDASPKAKTIYIAGPMRGLPQFNFPAFDEAAARGRGLGHAIISPAEIDREQEGGATQTIEQADALVKTYARRDTECLLRCTAIAMLPGWEKSKGATAEYHFARWIGLELLDARTFGPLATEPESILQEAQRITRGDRQDDYGHPLDEHALIGRLWGDLLAAARWKQGEPVPPALVADLMILLKMARDQHRRKRDNAVDQAGYADCRHRIIEEEQRRAAA